MSDKLMKFDPENVPQAMELSRMLATSSLIPSHLRGKPGDVLVILMKGRELGLSALQALSEIYVVEGRPSASAKLKVALCVQHPDICEYFRLVESSPKSAVYETKRAGSPAPVRMTWTLEQAQRAALTNRATWKTYPETMLRHRCASALADSVYPDLVQGLLTDDEAEDIKPRTEKDATPQASTKSEALKSKLREKMSKAEPEDAQVVVPAELPAETGIVDVPPTVREEVLFDAASAKVRWERIKAMGAELGMDAAAVDARLKLLTGGKKRIALTEDDVQVFARWADEASQPVDAEVEEAVPF